MFDYEAGSFWNQPSGFDLDQAIDELGLEKADLEDVEESTNIPIGKYPTLDRVFERAHSIGAEGQSPN